MLPVTKASQFISTASRMPSSPQLPLHMATRLICSGPKKNLFCTPCSKDVSRQSKNSSLVAGVFHSAMTPIALVPSYINSWTGFSPRIFAIMALLPISRWPSSGKWKPNTEIPLHISLRRRSPNFPTGIWDSPFQNPLGWWTMMQSAFSSIAASISWSRRLTPVTILVTLSFASTHRPFTQKSLKDFGSSKSSSHAVIKGKSINSPCWFCLHPTHLYRNY